MDLKIEKDVPMPQTVIEFLKSMEVGDSVVCSKTEYHALRTSANNSQSVKVATRQLEDGSYRVWRTQ
jgi:hypothetical protein